MPEARTPLLEVRGLCKQFPGVRALHKVSLQLHQGEVLALIGENGAGKSTLMKILAGVHAADSGEYHIDDNPVAFQNVRNALAAGVALIHQELNLAANLDLAANIFLGREPSRFGFVDDSLYNIKEVKSLTCNLGDIVFFDSKLIHGSGDNTSSLIRWSCQYRYNDLLDTNFIQRGYPHPYLYRPMTKEEMK